MMKKLIERFATRITSHPGRAFLAICLVGAVALVIASKLKLESSYLALLPEKAPEVEAIEKVRKYSGGTSELVIAVGGPRERRLPYARRLVAELDRSQLVEWAEAELPSAFFRQVSLYLLPAEELRELTNALDREVRRAKEKANPLALDLDDDEPKAAKGAAFAALRARYAQARKRLRQTRTTADGKYLLISVKPRASASQLSEGKRVLAGLQAASKRARIAGDEALVVRFTGSLVLNQEQNERMSADLSLASLIALVLAMGLITLVSRRLAATLVVGAPLVLGVLVTLAVATLAIGHLNLVSGFLVAALVGLGVDFGIHLYLRYLDELAEGCPDARQAMRQAIMATFGPCLTAALTTAAAFLALLAADFRGFSEYGLIAAIGVMLTLLVTFVALPPLALFFARFDRGVLPQERTRLRRMRQLARPLAWAMVATGFAFVAFSGTQLKQLSFYNNFKRLQGSSASTKFDDYISREMGGSLSPALLMVDSLQDAKRAQQIIEADMAADNARANKDRGDHSRGKRDASLIARVASVASLLPTAVDERRALLERLRDRLALVLAHGEELAPADRASLQELHTLTTVPTWGVDAVPESFRRRLVAQHGGKYFVLLWPREDLQDDRQIQRWAGSLRGLTAKLHHAGIGALVLDENLIAARVVELIRADGPRVLALAAGAVLLILILDFRRFDRVLLVGSSVVLGVTAMLGLMVLFDMHLNLFNAVVLPTVLGIGIDNAVHLMHAYQARGRGSVPIVISTAGRAALLSSATTAIGFGASIVAQHVGIQQLGVLALIGIGTTFATSSILLPAVLRLLEGDGKAIAAPALATPSRAAAALSAVTSRQPAVR